jgi:ubiquinone/menaquinone biosynthesis C-methylase UbiE
MSSTTLEPAQADKAPREQYAYRGYAAPPQEIFARRTATTHAAFLLPYLRGGARLLDCGCGPGSITCGFAQIVAPGEVIGIDVDESVLEMARARAVERGLTNLRFEYGNIYELPFPDHSFDAVFANAVLEHLSDPVGALREMRRVLKPGGVIGIRDVDFDGNLLAPTEPPLQQTLELWERLITYKGGNPTIGKHLHRLLLEVGFCRLQASASYECRESQLWGNFVAFMLTDGFLAYHFTELGWASPDSLQAMCTAWRKWGQESGAFFADAWVEAVGWAALPGEKSEQ